jgi:Fe-S-cluster-containing dehydrogenase component
MSEKHLSDWDPKLNRRQFLNLGMASLAAMGFTGCIRPPVEKIFSYVRRPDEETLPGEFHYFATQFLIGGLGHGIVAANHEGRPTKIDGNPTHPSNLGTASAFQQAHLLSLYDPDRAQEFKLSGGSSSWDQIRATLKILSASLEKSKGEGLVFVTEASTSPTLFSEMAELKKRLPLLQWIQYEPLQKHFDHQRQVKAVFDFSKIKNVVSLDSDFLSDPLFPVSSAKAFMSHQDRKVWVAESTLSLIGTRAEERVILKPSEIAQVLEVIYQRALSHGKPSPKSILKLSPAAESFATRLVDHLLNQPSESTAFLVSASQDPELQSLAQALNAHFGKDGIQWVELVSQAESELFTTGGAAMAKLAQDLKAGKISALFLVGGNPAYAVPESLGLGAAISQAKWSLRLSLAQDETAKVCQNFVPLAHDLETWGDVRSPEGSAGFIQPMISPLYDGKTFLEVLSVLNHPERDTEFTALQIVQNQWRKVWTTSFDQNWREGLRQGFIANSARTAKPLGLEIPQGVRSELPAAESKTTEAHDAYEIQFCEDSHTYDGRYSNHAWLQEFPSPLTRITWGNVALLHPDDAKKLNVKSGEVISLHAGAQTLEAPAWIIPGQAKNCITLSFGYGRTSAGKVGNGHGHNAYTLWNGNRSLLAEVRKTSKTEEIACTQEHHSMEGRDLVRVMKKTEVDGSAAKKPKPYFASLYSADPTPSEEHAWSMVIDLDQCTGCGACVIACQSENNIPSVGKEAVLRGREMHWIRVDRYFANSGENPVVHFQPVTCMHCEKAPCETVCPTGATVTGNGGINQMVYNRCVGTRYCSNNCPYKVRRFNFLSYNEDLKQSSVSRLSKNPNVSVRSRGVMEKCSYCVQRVNLGRITAANENRKVLDLEIKTACQMTCPTEAIHFGDLNNEKSVARRLRESPRNYSLLEELGTKPRTTYLAKIERERS